MQLVQGQHAQAYNRRRNRHGAFWEDRYHATMIEEGVHLWRCLAYIDLNMVRTGVVEHPREWEWTGYNERMRGQMSHRQTLETDPLEPDGDLWALREAHSPYRLNSGRKTASKRQTSH